MSGQAAAGEQVKKTAVACLTCRTKRQKCDGNTPSCQFCLDNKLQCSYPEVQKRRGPPPGYLKAIERRAQKLEAFLVYLLEEEEAEGHDHLRRLLEDGADRFNAMMERSENDSWTTLCDRFKDTLPSLAPPGTTAPRGKAPAVVPLKRARTSSTSIAHGNGSGNGHSSFKELPEPAEQTLDRKDLAPALNPNFDPEISALESMSMFGTDMSSRMYDLGQEFQRKPPAPGPAWTSPPNWTAGGHDSARLSSFGQQETLARPHVAFDGLDRTSNIRGDVPNDNDPPESSSTGMKRQAFEVNYTSSFWRGNDSRYPSPEAGVLQDTTSKVQLPPKAIQIHLMQVYLDTVHPQLPLLNETDLRAYMDGPNVDGDRKMSRNLILAICSYSACFSPTCGGLAPSINTFGGDSAGGTLAEIWSEEAWNSIFTGDLKRRCGMDVVQTLCLIALREGGKGQDFQAWILLGLAVRIAQDLDLGSISSGKARSTSDRYLRRRVWNCVCVLDLMLSLQLGRQPAVRRHDFAEVALETMSSSPQSPATGIRQHYISDVFEQRLLLCSLVSQMQSKLYLNGDVQESEMLTLRNDLESWYQRLPHTCRVSLGHNMPLETLVLHMSYYAFLVLLYRPFDKDEYIAQAMNAASSFNILLDAYRLQNNMARSHPTLVYLVFTVSISFFLSTRRHQTTATAFTSSLSAQAALLKCLEALDGLAQTWPIAKRCHRVLERLIDGENFDALSGRPRKDPSNPATYLPQIMQGNNSAPQQQMPATSMNWPTEHFSSPGMMPPPMTGESIAPAMLGAGQPPLDILGTSTGWGFETMPEWDASAWPSQGTPTDLQALLAGFLGGGV